MALFGYAEATKGSPPIMKCPNKGFLYQTEAKNCECCKERFLLVETRLEVRIE